MTINELIFEQGDFKEIPLNYSKEEAFRRLSSKVTVTKTIPISLRKKYAGDHSKPYFTGVVDEDKNRIELLYNPTTNNFVRVSAKIISMSNSNSKLQYQVYKGSEMMFYSILFFLLQIMIFMPWKTLAENPVGAGLFAGTILTMSLVRMIEIHKIIRDKRISISLKLQRFFSLGLLSFGVLLAATCIFMLVQNGKIIWQIPLVMLLFFAALKFLKRFGGTHFQEEKFTEIFK